MERDSSKVHRHCFLTSRLPLLTAIESSELHSHRGHTGASASGFSLRRTSRLAATHATLLSVASVSARPSTEACMCPWV